MVSLRHLLRGPSNQQLAVGAVGLVLTFLAELAVPPGSLRATVAALGSVGFSVGAIGRVGQALAAAPARERPPWVLIGAGVAAWLVGKLVRSMILVAEVPLESPNVADGADLIAAVFFVAAFVAFLRGQRIAVYALVLDAAAVVFAMTAAIAFAVQDVFLDEMAAAPIATIVVVLYTLLYAAATASGISALFAVPADASQRSQRFLVMGIGAVAAAYAVSLPLYLDGTFASGTLADPLWMAGMLAISVAASASIEDRAVHVSPRTSHATLQVARMVLPAAVAAVTAFLILLAEGRRTEGIIAVAAALITIVLATRTGLALYANFRLSEIEGRRARQFEALYEVGLAAAGERSLEELLRLVVEQATSLSRTDGAMLALAEPDRRYVIRALHKGGLPQLRDSVGEPLAGLSRAALEKRDLVVAERYEDHPSSTVLLHGIIKSAIAIPLVAHGEVIGTLAAYSATPRRFSSDTRRLVHLYAAQAAIAIANAQLLAETHRLARDDDLTGVMNRRSLMERLESEIHGATRHGDILAVVLCDVDGLKAVNDSAGHLAGNEVLMKVARVMRETVRAEDVVARFGGDEFVILLPRTGLLPAQALVGRIAARLRDEGYHWAGREQPVPGVSFGIAWFPEDGRTADALIAAADERMYVEKARGRSRRESAAEGD